MILSFLFLFCFRWYCILNTIFFVTSRIRYITSEKRDSSSSDDVSISSSLQKSLFYIAVAFVIFFGSFSGTYFYKHCIKKLRYRIVRQVHDHQTNRNSTICLFMPVRVKEKTTANQLILSPFLLYITKKLFDHL